MWFCVELPKLILSYLVFAWEKQIPERTVHQRGCVYEILLLDEEGPEDAW